MKILKVRNERKADETHALSHTCHFKSAFQAIQK